LGIGDKLVTFFKFLLLVPLEVLAHLFNLLLRRLVSSIILFGQHFGHLLLLLEGSILFILGREFFLKALAKSLSLMLKPPSQEHSLRKSKVSHKTAARRKTNGKANIGEDLPTYTSSMEVHHFYER
jgi:hypothetical protein